MLTPIRVSLLEASVMVPLSEIIPDQKAEYGKMIGRAEELNSGYAIFYSKIELRMLI